MARLRLRDELARQLTAYGIPFVGVSSGAPAAALERMALAEQKAMLRIDYAPEASAQDRADGAQVLADLDPLDAVRASKLADLRRETTTRMPPAHDQRNAALGVIDAAPIVAAITAHRAAYQEAKVLVLASETVAEVEGVTI